MGGGFSAHESCLLYINSTADLVYSHDQTTKKLLV